MYKLHEYMHKMPLSNIIYKAVKPIYIDLSTDDLLTLLGRIYSQQRELKCVNGRLRRKRSLAVRL